MAVKDGLGPRPVAQTAKRYFLNRLKLAPNLDFTCVSALPTATLLVSSWSWLSFCTASVQAGVQGPCRRAKTPWQWRTDWARGPYVAQTAKRYFLSRLKLAPNLDFTCVSALPTATLLVSSWSWLSFCTASVQAGVQGPCRRAKTPWQWRTDWARGP